MTKLFFVKFDSDVEDINNFVGKEGMIMSITSSGNGSFLVLASNHTRNA
jgi:hypothetical protein